jgi:serine protease DegQ
MDTLSALSTELAAAVERAGRAVVAVSGRQRIASSGVHWKQGAIVTADHTLKREEDITVTLPDGRTVPATLSGRDPSTDLAVLQVKEVQLPVAQLGDTATLKVGHLALAIGRSSESGLSASLGVISLLGGAWRTWRGGQIDSFIRPDLRLYPGLSGGPLVDLEGRVLGINTSGLTRTVDVAIPAFTVSRIADELLKRGRVSRGYLGLGMHPVQLPTGRGLVILTVEPEGPAGKAGALIGDVLVKLDGRPVADTDDIQAILGAESVGKTIEAAMVRGGTPASISITVGERPRREK